MKITEEVRNRFIAVKFEQKILPVLKLSKEEEIKIMEAIKTNVLQKRAR